MSSYKGRHGQPLDRVEGGPIALRLALPARARQLFRGSGGGGRGPEISAFRGSCSVLAASLKARIQIRRVEEFLAPSEPPAAFYRRLNSRARTAEPAKVLYPLSSAKPSLVFLQKGGVELFINCKKRDFVIGQAEAGDVFGDAPLVGMSTFDAKARAVSRCRFVLVPAETVESSVLVSHALSTEWLRKVSSNLAELQGERVAGMFAPARQRLAALLLKLADEKGVVSGVNHLALAGRLGVYRETVSTRLREMKAEGIVRVSREMITILDRDRLESIATVFGGSLYD